MADEAVEVVRIRPQDGAQERLRAIREQLVAEYERHWPGQFRTRLLELEDGTWLDLWAWSSRELAERALAEEEKTPTFGEWRTLVEPLGFDWAVAPAWGTHPASTGEVAS